MTPTTELPTTGRRRARTAVRVTLTVLALYLVGRALAEPFVIDLHDPASYSADWGGPHLAGVLAVHCGPGLLGLVWLVHVARHGRRPAGDR